MTEAAALPFSREEYARRLAIRSAAGWEGEEVDPGAAAGIELRRRE